MKPKVLFAGSSKSRLVPALAAALASITCGHAVELLVDGVTTEPTAGTYTYDATSGNSGIRNGGTFKVNSGVNVTVNNSNNVWFGIGDGTGSSLLWLNGGSMILNSNWGTILGRTANGTITIDSGSLTVNKASGNDNGLLMSEGGATGIVNLNGSGTLTTYKISSTGANTSQIFNFNGGTLKPTASKADWFANTGNILTQVRNGGAKIDTAGFDVTIGEQLVHVSGDNAIDGGLTKSGNGTLTLSAANTFTGAVVVNGGTLVASTGNSAASGAFSEASSITVTGATLQSGTNSLFGYNGTKVKNITVNTGGVLTMNDGSDVNVGNVTLAGGTLAAIGTNHAGFGSWVFRWNSVLSVTENSTVSAVNVLMNNSSSINVAAGKTLSFTGTLTDTVSNGNSTLIKTGDGTMTVTNTNTYTGVTTISGGTLQIGNGTTDGSITNTSNVVNTATLAFNLAGNQNFNKAISGTAGNVTKAGAGTLTLSGNNTYTGTTTVSAGTLDLSGTNTSLGNLAINGATALTKVTAGATTINSVTNGTYIIGGGTLEIDGGALTLQGENSWFSVGNNDQGSGAGTLTLKSGSFTTTNRFGLTVANDTGTINIQGGTFTANGSYNNGIALGESSGGNGTLNLNGGVLITDRIRGGSGVGAVNFNGGKLQSTGDVTDAFFFADGGNKITTTIQSGGLKVGGTPNFTIAEGMGGTGGITKEDANTVIISGNNTFNGATTVTAGTLKVSGSIASSDVTVNGGILASGTTGTVGKDVTVNTGAKFAAGDVTAVGAASVANDLNFSSGSIFDWDLNTATNTYDTVSVTGALNITSGAKFNVVSSTAFTDAFWDTTRTWSNIFGSKMIDNFLVTNFLYSGSATAPTAEGSFTVTGLSLTWTAVPEPTTALAGLLLTAGLLRRRR